MDVFAEGQLCVRIIEDVCTLDRSRIGRYRHHGHTGSKTRKDGDHRVERGPSIDGNGESTLQRGGRRSNRSGKRFAIDVLTVDNDRVGAVWPAQPTQGRKKNRIAQGHSGTLYRDRCAAPV